jgi:hypothetical protein
VQEEVVGEQSSVGATAGAHFTRFTSTKLLALLGQKGCCTVVHTCLLY